MSMTRGTRYRLTNVGTRSIVLDGQNITYLIKQSPRARYVRLEVKPQAGLIIIVPRFYHLAHLSGLLREKSKWILTKLARYARLNLVSPRKKLKDGDTILYLGQDLHVCIQQNRERNSVKLKQPELIVSIKSAETELNPLLEGWYRKQAEKMIKERAEELCLELAVTYCRISIRKARTRWGSCSPKGNLNFNWKLMMAPEPVINYVIIHELAHLKEMNHSKRFWQLVAQHCPQYQEHRRWLKEHDIELSAESFS